MQHTINYQHNFSGFAWRWSDLSGENERRECSEIVRSESR